MSWQPEPVGPVLFPSHFKVVALPLWGSVDVPTAPACLSRHLLLQQPVGPTFQVDGPPLPTFSLHRGCNTGFYVRCCVTGFSAHGCYVGWHLLCGVGRVSEMCHRCVTLLLELTFNSRLGGLEELRADGKGGKQKKADGDGAVSTAPQAGQECRWQQPGARGPRGAHPTPATHTESPRTVCYRGSGPSRTLRRGCP